MSTPSASTAARAHRALDPLHSLIYFAPEADEEFQRVGLRPGRMSYFASRSAPMGPVSAGVTTATFYNFNPELVARHIPRAWTLASIQDILAARLAAVDRAMPRLLGDLAESPAVGELAGLVRTATADLPTHGRPLFAAHAELPWPDAPHLALWHGITLLREFRGDGHTAALLEGGLSGLEALVTHTATGFGFTEAAAKATRGWSDEQWDAAVSALRARGLLDAEGLTATGTALRDSVEVTTDRLASAPWGRLTEDQLGRLVEIGRGFVRTVAANGAWPDGVFGGGRR
jgi:GNAT superfamily N-acetyltransferase